MKMYGKKHMEDLLKKREFWDHQPVIQPEDLLKGNVPIASGPLEKKTIDDVKKELTPLPKGYEWNVVNLEDEAQVEEVVLWDSALPPPLRPLRRGR